MSFFVFFVLSDKTHLNHWRYELIFVKKNECRIEKMSINNIYTNLAIVIIMIESLLMIHIVSSEGYHLGDIFNKNLELKIICSNGSTVDFVSECPILDKCFSLKISDKHTLRCIPSLPIDYPKDKYIK